MSAYVTVMQATLSLVKDNGDEFLNLANNSKLARDACEAIDRRFRKIDRDKSLSAEQVLRKRVNAVGGRLTSGKTIFPLVSLRMALEPDLVKRFLMETGQTAKVATMNSRRIAKSFCRILGILFKAKLSRDIMKFVEKGFDDEKLPFKLSIDEDDHEDCYFSISRGNKTIIKVPGWETTDYENFDEWQKACLIPFFVRSKELVHHYKLSIPPWFLPIVERKQISSPVTKSLEELPSIVPNDGEGAQGIVTPIRLHPLTCNFETFPYQHSNGWLAMKERKPGPEKEFLQEVYASKVFGRKDGGTLRVCPLLCTFEIEYDEQIKQYLLFPLATGPLPHLWSYYPAGGGNGKLTPSWMARELYQLAKTLSRVHNDDDIQDPSGDGRSEYGRFGDIKPDNLLWFADHIGCHDAGSLLFTDMGLAKAHRKRTISASFPSKTRHSETYKAPEFFYLSDAHADRRVGIGRKADIWSFGCTLIEHLTWYLMGNKAMRPENPLFDQVRQHNPAIIFESQTPLSLFADFRDEVDMDHPQYTQDRFFSVDDSQSRVSVRQSVVVWIRILHNSPGCTAFIHDLLSFIQARMLDVDRATRVTAQGVANELYELMDNLSLKGSAYGQTPSTCTRLCHESMKPVELGLPYRP